MTSGSYVALDSLRIAHVDDNPYFRRIMKSMLVGLGVRNVLEGATVEEGWQLATAGNPDLLLLDWQIGGGSGSDLLDRIRRSRNEAVATLAVVFVSAHSDRRHVLMAAKLGANDFIVKPVSPRLLYDRIRRLTSMRPVYERIGARLRPIPGASSGPPPEGTRADGLRKPNDLHFL